MLSQSLQLLWSVKKGTCLERHVAFEWFDALQAEHYLLSLYTRDLTWRVSLLWIQAVCVMGISTSASRLSAVNLIL